MDHCPICSSHLQLIIQQLSTSAQHSIFNTKDEGSVDETNEDHNSDKPPKLADEKEDKLAAKIEEINLNISALKIPEPQSIKHPDIQISTELPVAKQSRPPHCKTCGHPTKGHQTTILEESVYCARINSVHLLTRIPSACVNGTRNPVHNPNQQNIITRQKTSNTIQQLSSFSLINCVNLVKALMVSPVMHAQS